MQMCSAKMSCACRTQQKFSGCGRAVGFAVFVLMFALGGTVPAHQARGCLVTPLHVQEGLVLPAVLYSLSTEVALRATLTGEC